MGILKTSLQALTVVSPIRTPVNEPGPEAAANTSTVRKVLLEDSSAESTAGNSQLEYSFVVVWGTTWRTALSSRTAMLPRVSHVSIARTIIYEQFYHSSRSDDSVLKQFGAEKIPVGILLPKLRRSN